MNPDRKRAFTFAIAAVGVCAIAYVFALSHHSYAPGARQVQQHIASYDDFQNPILNSYGLGHVIYFVFRKTYGAIAFATLGFCLSAIFARPARLVRTALLIGTIRAGLEIFERLLHRGDPTIESLFDIATGTVAGTLGAFVYSALARRAKWEPPP